MPLTAHSTLVVQDDFNATIAGMNGRAPSPTSRGSTWVDATGGSKWLTGGVAQTVRAGSANAAVSIDSGATEHTVECVLEMNSATGTLTNRCGLALGSVGSFTSTGTNTFYRISVEPSTNTLRLYSPTDVLIATANNITTVNPGAKILRATLRQSGGHNQISAWYDGTAATWNINQPSGSAGDTYTDTADLITAGNFAGLLGRSVTPLFSLFKIYTGAGGGGAVASVVSSCFFRRPPEAWELVAFGGLAP